MPATPPIPRTPEDRLASIVAALCQAVGAAKERPGWHAGLAGPLVILIWSKVSRLGQRFAQLVARIKEGKLPQPRSRPATPRQPAAERPPKPPPDPAVPRLPRRFGWLPPLVPSTPTRFGAGGYAAQLRTLLADPEMQALVGQAPAAMGRVLRPLCWMLGVELPPGLLPARKRRPRVKPPKPPPPPPPEPAAKPRPRGLCEPPGRYAPGAWVDRVPPHWRDVLEGTVAPRRRPRRKKT